MAQRNFVIIREQGIEPEVAQAMRVPVLHVPAKDEFKGMIAAEDIADLAKRDQKTILKMAVMEQWNDWQTDKIEEVFGYVRQLEAEIIRGRISQAKHNEKIKEQGWKWGILKWLGMAVTAALLAAFFRSLFGRP